MGLLLAGGAAATEDSAPAGVAGRVAAVPAFSGDRALELVRRQCGLGPRTPGSPGNAALRRLITETATRAGLSVVSDCFDAPLGPGGRAVEACNLIVSAGPAGGRRLWLAAHFDTRPWADQDPVAARRGQPVAGANDGGSGTAVLLCLLELMGRQAPPQGVDVLFLDAEDSGEPHDASGFCLGSRHLAGNLGTFTSPLSGATPRGLVLLDMIGGVGARVPQEGFSLEHAPDWTEAVFARAAELGLGMFDAVPGRSVFDDHVPFLGAGVPAVDLIDFDYPQWHTADDTPARCSAASLAQAGRLVTDLVYRP